MQCQRCRWLLHGSRQSSHFRLWPLRRRLWPRRDFSSPASPVAATSCSVSPPQPESVTARRSNAATFQFAFILSSSASPPWQLPGPRGRDYPSNMYYSPGAQIELLILTVRNVMEVPAPATASCMNPERRFEDKDIRRKCFFYCVPVSKGGYCPYHGFPFLLWEAHSIHPRCPAIPRFSR